MRERTPRNFRRPHRPSPRLETTTLWDYPSQQYGQTPKGDQNYRGATPAYVIWNVLQRYSKQGEWVVDPFAGSGTTLDVARDLGRRARGFDLAPYREDIEAGDARSLPLESGSMRVVFMDPPYGDHLHYSDHPDCIGKLSAYDPEYYRAMDTVIEEAARVLAVGGTLAIYVCDFFEKQSGFAPVGFRLLRSMTKHFELRDIIAVARHNSSLELGNYHRAAEAGNFFLRGFNYLFLGAKADSPIAGKERAEPRQHRRTRRGPA